MRALIFAAFLFLAPMSLAAEKTDDRFDCNLADNHRLCEMYRKDQDRRTPPILDLAALEDLDAVREARDIAKDRKALRTGNDYFRAATLLLHSSRTDDYLLSHIVSTQGLMEAPGHPRVRLLAALSLDRFLVARKKRQIFGTQTMGSDAKGIRWFPYDCVLSRRSRKTFLGDYPEPCERRTDRFATALARLASLVAPSPRDQLIDHIRSAEQLIKFPASRAARQRAAASLDAYLLATGGRQVFGTQTSRQTTSGARLDCGLLGSDIRSAFSVAGSCIKSERTAFR